CVSVMALSVSSPGEMLVFSVNVASPATPDPPSVAVHRRPTSPGCQRPSAGAHNTLGSFLSILLPAMSAGETAQLCTASHAWAPLADAAALAVSVPLATLVTKSTCLEAGPDPPSV